MSLLPLFDRSLLGRADRPALEFAGKSFTFGDLERNSIKGPMFWTSNLALSRLVPLSTAQTIELRLEAFNVTNHFNWGLPNANLLSPTFGRILSTGGDPRIIQLGIKYGF